MIPLSSRDSWLADPANDWVVTGREVVTLAGDGRLVPGRRGPVAIALRSRWAIGLAGAASCVAGSVAVFCRPNDAGPVALIAAGAVLFLLGVVGTLPTRLKWGDNEAQWQLEIAESLEQVDRATDEVGALLDRKALRSTRSSPVRRPISRTKTTRPPTNSDSWNEGSGN